MNSVAGRAFNQTVGTVAGRFSRPTGRPQFCRQVLQARAGRRPVSCLTGCRLLSAARQRNAVTGALLVNKGRKGIQPIRPLAEPLYVELQNMLQRQPTYKVKTLDFVRRHAMNPQAALPEFATAVEQLDGLPVQFGRYFIDARLYTLLGEEREVEARRR